jgi:hypothetical protein
MKAYTIYDKATGQILDNLTCPDSHVVNLSDEHGILDGHFPDDKFTVIEGVVLPVEVGTADVESNEVLEMSADVKVRIERNQALAASDWTQVADAPVDQAAWATYRQELRDITSQETFPNEVTWPVPPQ